MPFEVVGVLAERGPGLDLEDEDGQVYVPLSTAMHRLLDVDSYNSILLEVGAGRSLARAAAEVEATMRRRHARGGGLAKLPADFQVQSPLALAAAQLAAASRLAFLVRWIGASALAVSGLGILAIAWIGVRARTVEIGTRRALGATAGQIFGQLLGEAALLAASGCALGLAASGCALGLAAGRAGAPLLVRLGGPAPHLTPIFEWRQAAIALASALALNLLFALLPSWRAARLDPIRALRHE